MDVFFDDVEVSHERLVWQENAYYPFGLAIKPLERAPGHRWLYNGGSELEKATQWHETPFRIGYDAQVGRFHQIDKLADIMSSVTPYHYSFNNPILLNDPSGLCPDCNTWEDVLDALNNDPSSLSAGTYINDDNGGFIHITGTVLPGMDINGSTGEATMTNPFEQNSSSNTSPVIDKMGFGINDFTRNEITGMSILTETQMMKWEQSLKKGLKNGTIKHGSRHFAKLSLQSIAKASKGLALIGLLVSGWEATDKGWTTGASTMFALDAVMMGASVFFPPFAVVGSVYGVARFGLDLAGYDVAGAIDKKFGPDTLGDMVQDTLNIEQ